MTNQLRRNGKNLIDIRVVEKILGSFNFNLDYVVVVNEN